MIVQTAKPPEAFYETAPELTSRQQAAFEAYTEAVCNWGMYADNVPEDHSGPYVQRIQGHFDRLLDPSFTEQDRNDLSVAAEAAIAFRGADGYLSQCIFTLESGSGEGLPPIQAAENVRVMDPKYRASIFNVARLFVQTS